MGNETSQAIALRVGHIFDEPQVQIMDYQLGGLHIHGAGLKRVGTAIKSRHITIWHDGTLRADAQYDPEDDCFYFKDEPINFGSMATRSMIVHEGVHALIDLTGACGTTVLTAEVAAYTAQMLYRLNWGEANFRRSVQQGIGTAEGKIYFHVLEFIDRFKIYSLNQNKKSVSLERKDFEHLRELIHSHPVYHSRPKTTLQTANGVIGLTSRLCLPKSTPPVKKRVQGLAPATGLVGWTPAAPRGPAGF